MKFEEVLPALREGKTIEYLDASGNWRDVFALECVNFFHIATGEFRIQKEKVKYYPVIYKDSFGIFKISQTTYRTLEEAISSNMYNTVVMLITEIPELIEERDR